MKEVVTASVQHAMRAPLRARFKDLPTQGEERTKKKKGLPVNSNPDSAQDSPPPPPRHHNNRGDQSHSSAAPGSSKTATSTTYTAWIMTTSRLKCFICS
ncbi:hypothetical protein Tco_0702705 [Tanacetum coccineum]|uniref:Uncharacterized protein n=1 Tax=Tanacetum coccineum TaxID=301880 RepID=A0ABQ4XWS4_9ASTR